MTRRALIAVSVAAGLSAGFAADAAAMPKIHSLHPELRAARKAKKKVKAPTITSVSPLNAKVGDTLTITGKNLAGKAVRVYFLRSGGGVAITRADSAGSGSLVVKVPIDVTRLLTKSGSGYEPTRFQLRVLTARFSKISTAAPMITASPALATTSGATTGSAVTATTSSSSTSGGGSGPTIAVAACTLPTTSDGDGDGLTNAAEINGLQTDPCNWDSDGDHVGDGYEYQSAIDMNSAALPFPGKKPWPNPLDSSDAGVDHDGDGLTLLQEQQLNSYVHGPSTGTLLYSDGKQISSPTPAPTDPVLGYMDFNTSPAVQAGVLSDDERDADRDGLTNWDECCGRMTQDWWDIRYTSRETRYPNAFPGVSMTDPDSDGDGVLDGADDQDHDGLSNAFEVSRPWDWADTYVSRTHTGQPDAGRFQANGGPIPNGVGPNPWARVQPYNPCKPVWSATCHLHWPVNYYGSTEDWQGPDPSTLGSPPSAPWMYDANDIHSANGE